MDETTSTTSADTAPQPPQVFAGRYRVTGVLGHGGMADVYAATDEVLCREVAVKVFRPGPNSTADRQRFHAEVRTLAGLAHPNLVSLYDGGQDVASPWCVMQLLGGGTLAGLTEPQDAPRVAELGAQLADGLAYIHQLGIVHRDVKPSNVLLDDDGLAYLSDFGVAQMVDASRLTASGSLLGTAAYLAPEQVMGQPIGPAVDVYALGLVLLETLTNRREYPGAPIESALARLSRAPQVPASLGPVWAELVGAMTSVDPGERPDAATVAARLRAISLDERVSSAVRATPAPGVKVPATVAPLVAAAPSGGLRRAALGLLVAAAVGVALTVVSHLPSAAPATSNPGAGGITQGSSTTGDASPLNVQPGQNLAAVDIPAASLAPSPVQADVSLGRPSPTSPARPPRQVAVPARSPLPTATLATPRPTGRPTVSPSPTASAQPTQSPASPTGASTSPEPSPASPDPSPKPSTGSPKPSATSPKPSASPVSSSPAPSVSPSPGPVV